MMVTLVILMVTLIIMMVTLITIMVTLVIIPYKWWCFGVVPLSSYIVFIHWKWATIHVSQHLHILMNVRCTYLPYFFGTTDIHAASNFSNPWQGCLCVWPSALQRERWGGDLVEIEVFRFSVFVSLSLSLCLCLCICLCVFLCGCVGGQGVGEGPVT